MLECRSTDRVNSIVADANDVRDKLERGGVDVTCYVIKKLWFGMSAFVTDNNRQS